jgi:hypothetical protein
MIISLEFLLYSSIYIRYDPIKTAKEWYKSFLQFNYQNMYFYTCNDLRPKDNIPPPGGLLNVDINLSEVNFKLANRNNTFKVSGDKYVIIEATGKAYYQYKGITLSKEVNNRWYFVHEEREWRWCGDLVTPPKPEQLDITIFIVAIPVIAVVLIIFANRKPSPKVENEYLKFLSPPDEDKVNGEYSPLDYINYKTGEIKSIDSDTGNGVIETSDGQNYRINRNSAIDRKEHFHVGEEILFQDSFNQKENEARNVVRVNSDSENLDLYSKQLRKLAFKLKNLRRNLRKYNVRYINKEIDACRAWLEILHSMAADNDIELSPLEIVLTNNVERDLNEISKLAEANQQKASLWSVILNVVLKMLGVIADILSIVSFSYTPLLVKSITEGIAKLLGGQKPPPSLGPGSG